MVVCAFRHETAIAIRIVLVAVVVLIFIFLLWTQVFGSRHVGVRIANAQEFSVCGSTHFWSPVLRFPTLIWQMWCLRRFRLHSSCSFVPEARPAIHRCTKLAFLARGQTLKARGKPFMNDSRAT